MCCDRPAAFFMARSPTREDVPLKRKGLSPALFKDFLVSYVANHAMRCLKTNGPMGFSPNELFAWCQQRAPVIASEGSRAASNWQGRIQLGRLIGSAPYCCGRSVRACG